MAFMRFNEMSETWKEYKKTNPYVAVTFWTIADVKQYASDPKITDAHCEDILESFDRHGMDGIISEGNWNLDCIVNDCHAELKAEAKKAKRAKANKKKAGSK
jgi:hypothetical protein